jgi:hypothetical protein
MRNLLLLLVAAFALCACDYFDTATVKNKADNERKLKELQWALLVPSASPPAVPTAALSEPVPASAETTPAHSEDTPGGETPPSTEGETAPPGEPATPPAPPPAAPAPEQAGTAASHAGTTGSGQESSAEHPAGTEVPIEHDPAKAQPTTVAVLAVVDSVSLLPAGEDEDPAERAKKLDLSQRRERVVRQELQNVLVSNSLITVVQPNEAQIAQARAEISATNSAALSNTMLPGLAETLGVQHVVTALVDLDGGEVNVVAQHAPDGTIVFQDTLIEWDVVLAVAKEAAAKAGEAPVK